MFGTNVHHWLPCTHPNDNQEGGRWSHVLAGVSGDHELFSDDTIFLIRDTAYIKGFQK